MQYFPCFWLTALMNRNYIDNVIVWPIHKIYNDKQDTSYELKCRLKL